MPIVLHIISVSVGIEMELKIFRVKTDTMLRVIGTKRGNSVRVFRGRTENRQRILEVKIEVVSKFS